jgi:hypothetical protein
MDGLTTRRAFARRLAFLFVSFFAASFWAPSASAYAWMIRHDYTGCATCHVDPSGGGVLTAYGRAQSDLLLRTRYGGAGASEEPSPSAGFLWGAVDPPDWFLPSGTFRALALATKTGSAAFTRDFILMQADLRAAVVTGHLRAYGSVGVVSSNGSAASLAGNVVSREHWVGYAFGADDAFLVRAGRIDLPYGLRSIEHTLFVRSATRTDLNDTQQHGVSLAYSGDLVRGEVMGIAGNYQVSSDAYRERGYSAYVEVAPWSSAAFGASSLVTHAAKDLYLKVPDTRQAHGIYARYAPVTPLVLMAEGDVVVNSATGTGYATMLQADVEPIQGLHFIATGEVGANAPQIGAGSGSSYSGWLGVNWFFAPHADVRIDAMRESVAMGQSRLPITAVMAQLHVFL